MTPIKEPGNNANHIEGYKPISLLNTLTKTIDTIKLKRLKIIEHDKNIPQEQYRIRKGHSVVAKVIRIPH